MIVNDIVRIFLVRSTTNQASHQSSVLFNSKNSFSELTD